MATKEYIGARYVPLMADPLEWDKTKTYEPLTIVSHAGNSYTSRQYVPADIEITDESYWALTGNYNAQVEQYRKETATVKAGLETETTTRENADVALSGRIAPLEKTMPSKLSVVAHDDTIEGAGTYSNKLRVNLNRSTPINGTANTVYPALAKDKTSGDIKGLAFNAGTGLTAYDNDDADIGPGIRLNDETASDIDSAKNWIATNGDNIAYSELETNTNNATEYSDKKYKTNRALTHQRRTYGQYHTACVASFMANETTPNPTPQILGGTTRELAKNYTDRDSVAIYASNSFYPETVYEAKDCTYSDRTVVVSNLDANTVEVGMFLDAYNGTPTANKDWIVGKITAIAGNTITVDGWFQQRDDGDSVAKTPNGLDLHVNRQTKIWGENIVVNNPDGKPSCGFELGCILPEDSSADTSGVDVVTLSGKGASAYRARGKWDCMFDARQSNNDAMLAFATKLTNVNVGGEIRNPHLAIEVTQQSADINENTAVVLISGTNQKVNVNIKGKHAGKMVIVKNYKTDAITINNHETLKGNEGHLYVFDGNTWMPVI